MPGALGKKQTACIPCHERKVRCDTTTAGVPCTRCITKNRADACTPLVRGAKSGHKRKRADDDFETRGDAGTGEVQTPVSQYHQLDPDVTSLLTTYPETQSPLDQSLAQPYPPREVHGSPAPVQYMVSEDDAHLQTLCRMSSGDPQARTPVTLSSSEQGQRVIEYYGELNSVTVLGEILGQSHRRLIRIDLPGPQATGAKQREFSCLGQAEVTYLNAKGVHDTPLHRICISFLRLFFQYVYPYTPVLDRAKLLADLEHGECSTFLLWSIMANVTPFASPDLLLEAGYEEASVAQKDFFTKARLLYDFGCEKGQLNLIQGSILLSSFQFSFAPDKDFRFWFHNAVRIAIQMGFNKREVGLYLYPATHGMAKRIWWVLYSRDIWFNLAGYENARRIHDADSNVEPIRDEDWAAETTSESNDDALPEITTLNRHFFRENCQLAVFGMRFLDIFRVGAPPPSMNTAREFVETLSTWRGSLPDDLLLNRVVQWTSANVWILFLWAMSYRLEGSFYRMLRQQKRTSNDVNVWAARQFPCCIFELDTLLRRAVVHEVAQYCPPSLIICASHLLGFQLDLALDSNTTAAQKLTAKTQIHAGLAYLREAGEKWLNAKWTCRVFEYIIRRVGLSIGSDDLAVRGPDQQEPMTWRQNANDPSSDFNLGQLPTSPIGMEGLPDHWIENLLAENMINSLDDGVFNVVGL